MALLEIDDPVDLTGESDLTPRTILPPVPSSLTTEALLPTDTPSPKIPGATSPLSSVQTPAPMVKPPEPIAMTTGPIDPRMESGGITPQSPDKVLRIKRLALVSQTLDALNANFKGWENAHENLVANYLADKEDAAGLPLMPLSEFRQYFSKKGLGDVDPMRVLDVYGVGKTIPDAVALGSHALKLNARKGTPIEAMDQDGLDAMEKLLEYNVQAKRPGSAMNTIVGGIADIIPFGVELAITGATFGGGGGGMIAKAAAKKGVRVGLEKAGAAIAERVIEKGVVRKVADVIGRSTLRTLPTWGLAAVTKTIAQTNLDRMGNPVFKRAEDGSLSFNMESPEGTWAQAYTRNLVGDFTERFTEMLGGEALIEGGGAIIKALKKLPGGTKGVVLYGAMKDFAAKYGGDTAAKVQKAAYLSGWDGFLAEMSEEQLAQFMHYTATQVGRLTGTEEWVGQGIESPVMGWGEQATTAAVLAVPSLFWGGMGKAGRQMQRNKIMRALQTDFAAQGVSDVPADTMRSYADEILAERDPEKRVAVVEGVFRRHFEIPGEPPAEPPPPGGGGTPPPVGPPPGPQGAPGGAGAAAIRLPSMAPVIPPPDAPLDIIEGKPLEEPPPPPPAAPQVAPVAQRPPEPQPPAEAAPQPAELPVASPAPVAGPVQEISVEPAKQVEIQQAAAETDTIPTEAQKEAGNYAKQREVAAKREAEAQAGAAPEAPLAGPEAAKPPEKTLLGKTGKVGFTQKQVDKAESYIRKIRNGDKQRYANAYLAWKVEGIGDAPAGRALSVMARQAVELEINGILKGETLGEPTWNGFIDNPAPPTFKEFVESRGYTWAEVSGK